MLSLSLGSAGRSNGGENPPAHESSDDSQNDVENQAFTVLLTILLPMKPAISPTTIHEMMPIVSSCSPFDRDNTGD